MPEPVEVVLSSTAVRVNGGGMDPLAAKLNQGYGVNSPPAITSSSPMPELTPIGLFGPVDHLHL